MTDAREPATGKAGASKKALAPKRKPKWDVSTIQEWGPSRHELGATIPEAGNSAFYVTGGWRSQVPVLEPEKCTSCTLCYFYCPDASILVEGGKAAGIDLAHCKGCGICARECPAGAIRMMVEEKE